MRCASVRGRSQRARGSRERRKRAASGGRARPAGGPRAATASRVERRSGPKRAAWTCGWACARRSVRVGVCGVGVSHVLYRRWARKAGNNNDDQKW
eukprot:731937-Prymnesium_polylepis.1